MGSSLGQQKQASKAVNVYNLVDEFCKTNGLNWTQSIGWLSTGGAPAVLGKRSRFGALIKEHDLNVVIQGTHVTILNARDIVTLAA